MAIKMKRKHLQKAQKWQQCTALQDERKELIASPRQKKKSWKKVKWRQNGLRNGGGGIIKNELYIEKRQ